MFPIPRLHTTMPKKVRDSEYKNVRLEIPDIEAFLCESVNDNLI